MPEALVAQSRISLRDPDSRIPVAHFKGEKVELSAADYKRLKAAGAVVSVNEKLAEPEEPQTVEEAPSLAEQASSTLELADLSHKELDRLGKEHGVTFESGAVRRDKAEALAAAGVTV